MDTKYTVIELSERLEQLVIEINAALRPEKIILFTKLIEVPKILTKLNSIENQNTVRKNILYILYNGFTNILSEFDYATLDKKNELIQVISDMEPFL